MSKKVKNVLVPSLRFPEFQNSGVWHFEKGGCLFDQITNKDHNSDLPILAITQERGAIPREQIDYNVVVTDKSLESYKVVDVGDFIISLRSFQGGIEYSSYKGICSPAYVVLRKKNESISDFFKHYFKTRLFIRDLNKNLEGLRDGKMVSYKQFSDLLLPSPSTKEQQKIADCLSSLDELITAENQKLEALKAHKKGLMQQLFPAEGEKVPKLRFKEFKDSGEWEEKTLEEIAIFLKGKGISKSDITINGAQPCIRYGELYTRYKEVIGSVISFTNLPPEDLILSEENDVIIPSSGETREDIATASCVLIQGIALGGDLNILRSEINGVFLAYYLTHAKSNAIAKLAQGDAVVHLYASQLKKLSINFPKLKDEQKKIGESFSSIDDLIAKQFQKLETIKTHKKGLMQQLFPSINNTGE